MKKAPAERHFINRELSWLSFNERVLQEAQVARTPLIQRVRFLGIFSNNLDEFYRVPRGQPATGLDGGQKSHDHPRIRLR